MTVVSFKVALGFFVLSFFLNYSPNLGYPPFRKISTVKASTVTETQSVVSNDLPDSFQLPFPGYLSNPFSANHPGIDIATGLGMPIHPIGSGTVIDTGYNFWGLGLIVVIDHGKGYKSLYAHMGEIYVNKGQKVTKSTILGVVGLTGNTTGPHTHLEITKNGVHIDPLTVLPPVRRLPQPSDFQAVQSPNLPLNKAAMSTPAATISLTSNTIYHPALHHASTNSAAITITPKQIKKQFSNQMIQNLINEPKKKDPLAFISNIDEKASQDVAPEQFEGGKFTNIVSLFRSLFKRKTPEENVQQPLASPLSVITAASPSPAVIAKLPLPQQ